MGKTNEQTGPHKEKGKELMVIAEPGQKRSRSLMQIVNAVDKNENQRAIFEAQIRKDPHVTPP